MLKSVLNAVFGDPHKKEIKKLTPLVDEVNALEDEMKRKSDAELRQMLADFRENIARETAEPRAELATLRQQAAEAVRLERQKLQVQVEQAEKRLLRFEDELLAEIQPQVFAAVREASWRAIAHRHFDVQAVGGALLH